MQMLNDNTVSVKRAIRALNSSGDFNLRSGVSNKMKTDKLKKWFNNIDSICRGRHDIELKINAIRLLEETVIGLQNGIGNYEFAKRYCDLLLHLLRQSEKLRTRSHAAIVFARLMKITSSSEIVDLRKCGANYANQALPLLVNIINISLPSPNDNDTTPSPGIGVAGLYAICCIMEHYPASTRNPPRKMVRTMNTMIDHIDESVQGKAAECYAAFTFAKQNSATWTKQLLLLFSNIDVIVELHLKGNYNVNVNYSGTDSNLKFLFNPKEMQLSNGTLERRLRGLFLCIENLILSSPTYFQSIPIFFPLNIAIDTLDKLILACMSMSEDMNNNSGINNNKVNSNGSSDDDDDDGSDNKTKTTMDDIDYNADKIALICTCFDCVSIIFQAIFQATGQHIIRNYTRVSLILTAMLRWSRIRSNRRLPGPLLSVLQVVYSFFEFSGPYLKKNFIETVAYYCLESFNIATDMDKYNSNITVKKKKNGKKRGRSNNSSWVTNNDINSSDNNDFSNNLNQTLLNERLLKCIETLNLIVFYTSPKLGSYIRKLLHDKLYDIFLPRTHETKFLNEILMSNVESRKAMYNILLTCTTIQCASSVPSLYTFTNGVLVNGLNDVDDNIAQLCRNGKIALLNMVKPTSVPFQTYVPEISTIERKNISHVVVNEENNVATNDIEMQEDDDKNYNLQKTSSVSRTSGSNIADNNNVPLQVTNDKNNIDRTKVAGEKAPASNESNAIENNTVNNIDDDESEDEEEDKEETTESATKKQKTYHGKDIVDDDDDDDGFPEIVL